MSCSLTSVCHLLATSRACQPSYSREGSRGHEPVELLLELQGTTDLKQTMLGRYARGVRGVAGDDP